MAKESTGTTKKTVAIVGGGIAGLVCAQALKARGFHVTVLEDSVYLGGKLGAHRERLLGVQLPQDQARQVDKALDGGKIESLYQLLSAAQPGEETAAMMAATGFAAAARRVPNSASKQAEKARSPMPTQLSQPPITRLQEAVWHKLRAVDEHRPTVFSGGFEVQASDAAPYVPPDEAPAGGDALPPDGPVQAAAKAARAPAPAPAAPLPHQQDRWWRVRRTRHENDDIDPFSVVVSRYKRPGMVRYEITDDVYHEHCYHMFLGWYLNFWKFLGDVGISRAHDFEWRDQLTHLFPGPEPMLARTRTLERSGSISTSAENLLSGTASVPDLFLWMYSSVDLMGQQYDRQRYLDYISVNGFMSSRWYATEDSAKFHEYLLVKAFAVPTYFSSAPGYRKFLEYTAADNGRMLYVLKGNTYDKMFARIAEQLTGGEHPIDLRLGTRVTRVVLPRPGSRSARIGLNFVDSDIFRRIDPEGVLLHRVVAFDGEIIASEEQDTAAEPTARYDCVVLAVPPVALGKLVDDIRDAVPGLGSVRVLQSGSTAALDLYFKVQLDHIPREHVVCRDSKYGLTFIDNSQLWHGDENMKCDGQRITCLNVAATDFYKLDGMSKRDAMDAIIDDLRRYLDFDDTEIDWSKTYLQMNQNEPLFLNEVGSERWRPATNTEVPNLFLAGDFCDNPIGVVCVEGAVVSGLMAARAVQAYVRDMPDVALDSPMLKPIEILEPYAFPAVNAQLLKLALAPTAAVAKALSVAEDLIEAPQRVLTPRALKALGHDVLTAPGEIAADMLCASVESWKWWLRAAYLGDDRSEH